MNIVFYCGSDSPYAWRVWLTLELAYFERELNGEFFVGLLTAADLTIYPMVALALRADRKMSKLDIHSAVGPRLATGTSPRL